MTHTIIAMDENVFWLMDIDISVKKEIGNNDVGEFVQKIFILYVESSINN